MVEFDEMRACFIDIKRSDRGGVTCQALEVIERHTQVVCDSQLDRVGVEDGGHDVLGLVTDNDLIQAGDDARLGL